MPAPKDPIKYAAWIAKKSAAVKGEKNPFYGKTHSDEMIEKLKRPKTEEQKKKQSDAMTGRKAHPNTVEATRKRMIENNPMKIQENKDLARKRFTENNPMRDPDVAARSGAGKRGILHSDERKEKERLAITAAQTDAVRTKKSASHMGKPLSQEHKDAISRGKEGVPKSEEHRKAISEGRIGKYIGENNPFYGKTHSHESITKMSGRPKTLLHRKRLSCSRRGIPLENFDHFVSFDPYCEKFDEVLKERVRHFQGNSCALCGRAASDNVTKSGIIRKLSVHHVFIEKLACCETRIEEMDLLRRRLPSNVALFGNADFSTEEILYIRMMVPLCLKCHGKMNGEPDSIEYERSIYRRTFAEMIVSKYQGNCYFSEEEFSKFSKTDS